MPMTALVVGRGGWLRLPDGLLRSAGIGGRAHVQAVPGGVLVSAAPGEPATQPAQTISAAEPAAWTPARAAFSAVTRSYRQGADVRRVLDGFAHDFVPGRMTAVTGRSGSGKTTLLRLIAGLDRPDAGALTIDGESLDALDAEQLAALRRRRIGYLPQEPAPVGFLSAEENVALALGRGAGTRARRWNALEPCSAGSAYRSGRASASAVSRRARRSGWRLPARSPAPEAC